MKVDAENLIPYTTRTDLGEAAYFDANLVGEKRLASAIALFLYHNAGGGHNIYREGNRVNLEVYGSNKRFSILVVEH